MLPAVVCDNRPAVIYASGQVIDRLRELLLLRIRLDLRNSPGFIERRPGDNAGMVQILPDNLKPFSGKFFNRVIAVLIRGRHLAPDQHAFHVAPVKETFVLDLHMLPQAVEAQCMNLVDIIDQSLLVRRRQMGILPVSLVKDQPLIERRSVQQNIAFLNPDLPHAEVRAYLIQNLCAFPDPDHQIIEFRLFGRPGVNSPGHLLRQIQADRIFHEAPADCRTGSGDPRPLILNHSAHFFLRCC